MQELEIGYCPLQMDWKTGKILITSKANLDGIIADVESGPGVDRDWIYAPEQTTVDIMSGKSSTRPFKSRVFGLPKTHTISHSGATSEERLRFLTWCLGFLVGMRLTGEEAGFIDATPIRTGVLHDIVWLGDSASHALSYADEYWDRHSSDSRKTKGLTGIIHSFFLSQTPTLLEFERFIYLYTALDGCYAVCNSLFPGKCSAPTHRQRIKSLCKCFTIAELSPASEGIVCARNETMHEALFFGEPLGFQLYGGAQHNLHGSTLLEMTKLVSRLIVAMLGVPATDYIQSRMDDRQRHGVRLLKGQLP
jgi:hypothetical protein